MNFRDDTMAAGVDLTRVIYVIVLGVLIPSSVGNVIQYSIREELPSGTMIGNVATDAKLNNKYSPSQMLKLTFRFLSTPGMDFTNFAIDENSGIIITTSVLDRDTLCPQTETCSVSLDVGVGPSQFFQVISTRIDIVDVNDNTPTFQESFLTHWISEATLVGTSISIPAAEDPDSGQNGIQSYELISKSQAFELQSTDGYDGGTELKLVVRSQLDRETVDSYELRVIAVDGGSPPKSGSILINITLLDANDNSPRFDNASREVSIPEDAPINTTVLQVRAVDADTGLNGRVMYTFTSRTYTNYGNLFAISGDSGVIYLRGKLDYEEESNYHLAIKAQDLGPESQPSYTTAIVNVLDRNDNAPQITVNTLTENGEAQISEASDVGTFVAHLSAIDHDHGQNGQFSCSLNSNWFNLAVISDTQYKIVTAMLLDREERDSYILQVICADHGRPQQSTIQSIRVTVLDENDHSPVFEKDYYSASVLENNREDAMILRVNATDPDADYNGIIRYSLNQEGQWYFAIDEKFGIISAKITLDHEALHETTFTAIARDEGNPSRSGTTIVHIVINDKDDEVPMFTHPKYSFGVFENQPPNTDVSSVTAIDKDSPPFNQVEYVLESVSVTNTFSIHPVTGQIKTTRSLDREKIPAYYMTILAHNPQYPGMSGSCSVAIHVADENDNFPIIDFPDRSDVTIQVSNMIPVGYVITRIRAHDDDVGNNAVLNYNLEKGFDSSLFAVDRNTGAVTTKKLLENIYMRNFTLRLQVSDTGDHPNSNYTLIHILVNSTIPYNPPAEFYTSPSRPNNSMVIVIGLSAASAAVLLLLIILLIYIRRQNLQRQRHTYRCRPEAQKMLRKSEDNDQSSADLVKAVDAGVIVTGKPPERKLFNPRAGRDPSTHNGDYSTWNGRGEPPPSAAPENQLYDAKHTRSSSSGSLEVGPVFLYPRYHGDPFDPIPVKSPNRRQITFA